ncbi:MAG: hypothetical protein CM15mP106_5190 [Candidatus Neomarinimicrobiota bacterium]|nr:MAG: hypothetical protein CM15mP106_5190 [Candidatus Neomarinimicrobiota bacterium]
MKKEKASLILSFVPDAKLDKTIIKETKLVDVLY